MPEHVLPQVIPAGLLVTVPLPVPIFSTARPMVGNDAVPHAVLE